MFDRNSTSLYNRAGFFQSTHEGENLQFYSLGFAIFLPLTFIAYWSLNRWGSRWQNLLLLLAGCLFYGWIHYQIVGMLILGASIDYLVGLGLMSASHRWARRTLLGVSLGANLGALALFKYFDFFLPIIIEILRPAGPGGFIGEIWVIVPFGISYMTLQRLTYTIEIYRNRYAGTRDWISFCAFASFFPLLISGPIERANQLLPQFLKARTFDIEQSKDALRRILWGLFKKIVIADSLAARVDFVFSQDDRLPGIDLAAGVFLFGIQLYADFSGYSDIALGISRLFGFRITRNFCYPYFSRDMAEFWRRWHVSLSFWFRDYIFTPLTMNVNIKARVRRMACVLLTFTASGLWHRASWTYIVWGFLNGLGFAPLVFGNAPAHQTKHVAEGRLLPSVREWLQMKLLFAYVLTSWIFFRATSVRHALRFIVCMLTHTWIVLPGAMGLVAVAVSFMVFEWFRRDKDHPLDIGGLHAGLRWGIYLALGLAIYCFGRLGQLDFIYSHF